MMEKTIKIGDVFKVSSGGTPSRKKPEYFTTGTIPWVKTGDLKGRFANHPSEYITEEALKNSSAKIFPPNTVLLAMYGATIGACSILNFEAATNQACAALLPTVKCEPIYLYYYLKSIKSELIRKGVGGAQPNISAGIIKDTKIPLPPLATQKKIAAILDVADAYRQKTKALIKKYDELSQSLFLDMFGDPVVNSMSWEKKKLGDLVENKDSKRVPVKMSDRDNMDGEYPYYGASGIIDYVDDYTHEDNNLLIGEDGANLVARSTPIAFIATGKYWVNNHAHVLGFNGKTNLVFLKFFINLIDLKPFVSGSAQPKLNRKNMDKIKVYNPPIKLQNQFAERIQKIEAQKAQAQESLEKAEELFNSLLGQAFKGEIK